MLGNLQLTGIVLIIFSFVVVMISSLFVPKIELVDLYRLFPEFIEPASYCKFTGCAHDKEPQCGVKDAVAEGKIAQSRYDNYLQIYGEMINERNNKYR